MAVSGDNPLEQVFEEPGKFGVPDTAQEYNGDLYRAAQELYKDPSAIPAQPPLDPNDPANYGGWETWKQNNPNGTFDQFRQLITIPEGLEGQAKADWIAQNPQAIHGGTGLPYDLKTGDTQMQMFDPNTGQRFNGYIGRMPDGSLSTFGSQEDASAAGATQIQPNFIYTGGPYTPPPIKPVEGDYMKGTAQPQQPGVENITEPRTGSYAEKAMYEASGGETYAPTKPQRLGYYSQAEIAAGATGPVYPGETQTTPTTGATGTTGPATPTTSTSSTYFYNEMPEGFDKSFGAVIKDDGRYYGVWFTPDGRIAREQRNLSAQELFNMGINPYVIGEDNANSYNIKTGQIPANFFINRASGVTLAQLRSMSQFPGGVITPHYEENWDKRYRERQPSAQTANQKGLLSTIRRNKYPLSYIVSTDGQLYERTHDGIVRKFNIEGMNDAQAIQFIQDAINKYGAKARNSRSLQFLNSQGILGNTPQPAGTATQPTTVGATGTPDGATGPAETTPQAPLTAVSLSPNISGWVTAITSGGSDDVARLYEQLGLLPAGASGWKGSKQRGRDALIAEANRRLDSDVALQQKLYDLAGLKGAGISAFTQFKSPPSGTDRSGYFRRRDIASFLNEGWYATNNKYSMLYNPTTGQLLKILPGSGTTAKTRAGGTSQIFSPKGDVTNFTSGPTQEGGMIEGETTPGATPPAVAPAAQQTQATPTTDNAITNSMVASGQLPASQAEVYPQQTAAASTPPIQYEYNRVRRAIVDGLPGVRKSSFGDTITNEQVNAVLNMVNADQATRDSIMSLFSRTNGKMRENPDLANAIGKLVMPSGKIHSSPLGNSYYPFVVTADGQVHQTGPLLTDKTFGQYVEPPADAPAWGKVGNQYQLFQNRDAATAAGASSVIPVITPDAAKTLFKAGGILTNSRDKVLTLGNLNSLASDKTPSYTIFKDAQTGQLYARTRDGYTSKLFIQGMTNEQIEQSFNDIIKKYADRGYPNNRGKHGYIQTVNQAPEVLYRTGKVDFSSGRTGSINDNYIMPTPGTTIAQQEARVAAPGEIIPKGGISYGPNMQPQQIVQEVIGSGLKPHINPDGTMVLYSDDGSRVLQVDMDSAFVRQLTDAFRAAGILK